MISRTSPLSLFFIRNQFFATLLFAALFVYTGSSVWAQSTDCQKTLVADFPKEIWQLPSSPEAVFFKAGLAIDADGAPNAYHPDNIGLDNLRNAGKPGNWWGVVTDTGKADGTPVVQGSNDPFPGYYVSQTALKDPRKKRTDPTAYVDSREIPYIALPSKFKLGEAAQALGIVKGDLAAVFNGKNSKMSYAIFADVGPRDSLGEGSIALAKNLGIKDSPKNGGTSADVVYVVFPRSGNGRPQTIAEIESNGAQLLATWVGRLPSGTPSPLNGCFPEYSLTPTQ